MHACVYTKDVPMYACMHACMLAGMFVRGACMHASTLLWRMNNACTCTVMSNAKRTTPTPDTFIHVSKTRPHCLGKTCPTGHQPGSRTSRFAR